MQRLKKVVVVNLLI